MIRSLSGKRALIEQLIADGVRYIFGNPGTTEQAFMDVLQEYPELAYVLCLHEGVAVSMADAYARATGRPAFVQLHIAPGLGNAIGMLYNAFAGKSPLIVYVGQSSSDALFQEPLLSADLVAMAGPVSKWAAQIDHAADLPQALRRAMNVAAESPRGPVVLAVPIDAMEEEVEVDIQPTSFTRWQAAPGPEELDAVAELLAGSTKPLLVIGDGVALSGAQAEITSLAEALGAPVYLGYSTEMNIDPTHPLFAGSLPNTSARAPQVADALVAQHDLVLVIGSPIWRFIFPRPGSPIPAGPKVIQIDRDSWELGKNVPGVLSVRADCKLAAAGLLDRLTPTPAAATRGTEIAARLAQSRVPAAGNTEGDGIDVDAAMAVIAAWMPEDAAIFEEAMTSGGSFNRHVRVRPGRYFRARGGGIGPGIPGAVGVKLAFPDRPVVGVVSDGSGMFSITAFWTAAHHEIPVVWVVLNNGGYRILKENIIEYLGAAAPGRGFVEMDLTKPDIHFDEIARSLGVHAERVEKLDDLRPALERALELGRPAVVDVAIRGLAS